MENFTKEKMLGYARNNRTKAALVAASALLVLVIFVNGIYAVFFEDFKSNNVAGYGYDSVYAGNEMIESDFAESRMAKGISLSGMVADTMPYPTMPQSEGVYDDESERKLIKNGNLSLVVKDIEVAQGVIKAVTKRFGGFVQSSNFSENEQYDYYGNERRIASVSKKGYFEVKIPSANFENSFSEFKKTALKVNNESVSGNDVTEQYADLESQIANKKSEVAQYREIMKRASKIEDVLKVTQYLNNAQSALDRLQGQMNRLSNQVELSTIRIDIVSEKDVEAFGIT